MTKTNKQYIADIRAQAEESLPFYARLIAPEICFGQAHLEVMQWLGNPNPEQLGQLLLYPRGHLKSTMIAIAASWFITRNPLTRIMYLSATATLAQLQVYFIGQILTSKVYRRYWPDMVNEDKGKRERWNVNEIIVDHPLRKAAFIKDPTLTATGLGGNITGKHCDLIILDDVVTLDNSNTETGRANVEQAYSMLASIKDPGGRTYAVGTRYDSRDLYSRMMEMHSVDPVTKKVKRVFDVMERPVETTGDGTGDYLWPRQLGPDGRQYGFDQEILSQIKAEYSYNLRQFYAQYYSKCNNEATTNINPDCFKYYDRATVKQIDGIWFVGNRPINLVVGVDFAFSLKRKADYTTIAVIGMDRDRNIYILDLVRFKTDKIVGYFEAIKRLYDKWEFKRIRLESVGAQAALVKELKYRYFPEAGIMCTVEEHNPTRHEGTKAERIEATLNPQYEQGCIYHYKDGNCELLELELGHTNPPHDDLKDALMIAVCAAKPAPKYWSNTTAIRNNTEGLYNKKFGGVAYN